MKRFEKTRLLMVRFFLGGPTTIEWNSSCNSRFLLQVRYHALKPYVYGYGYSSRGGGSVVYPKSVRHLASPCAQTNRVCVFFSESKICYRFGMWRKMLACMSASESYWCWPRTPNREPYRLLHENFELYRLRQKRILSQQCRPETVFLKHLGSKKH